MGGAIQAIDATTLRAVLAELRPLVVPGRFEKAQQSGGRTVQLGLRSLQGRFWLELSWEAEAPRLVAIPPPPRQGEGSTLAQQLQHGLRGLALVDLGQCGWERVVELAFAPRPGEPPQRWLVLELMGRHSNLFLLDGDRRVIAMGRQVRPDQSRLRPIGTGDPYRPPPPMGGDPPRRSESEASWRRRLTLVPLPLGRALREAYQGIGPALAAQLVAGLDPHDPTGAILRERPVTDLSPAQWEALWRRWQRWLAAVEEERFRLERGAGSDFRCWPSGGAPPPPAPGFPPADDPLAINRFLAGYYGERLGRRERERRRQALRQRLLAACAREQRTIARQQAALAAAEGCEDLQHRADALLCRADPGREGIEEAQKLYRQARRLRRSRAEITPRLAQHQGRLAWLESSLTYLEQAESAEDLSALEEEIERELPGTAGGAPPSRRTRRRGEEAGSPPPRPLELLTPGGVRVQVGRNHRQNEWISLRRARPGDLWFHAQECPGSHVVLKASERPVGEGDRTAAADLAAHFSRARGNRRVPVVMVPTDDLQRIRGAGPGTVRHRGGEILWGEPQRARALLAAPSLPEAGPS
ncbi:MAG: NFACT RNA binding domain-containing protein [Synechococcaceae cyanobacterium]|nr:NFACT RNA binding domain-containing protein [Synechococcaceae cyanobacterium]